MFIGVVDLAVRETIVECLETSVENIQLWNSGKCFDKTNANCCEYRQSVVNQDKSLLVLRNHWRFEANELAKIEESVFLETIRDRTDSISEKPLIGDKGRCTGYWTQK